MKPIIIAGNGPSLAQIDYSRLPQDFDVFRCNQFYFEDKYFLGKNIKGVFFNYFIFKEQFFTLHYLKEKNEYEVEDVYCMNEDIENFLIDDQNFNFIFPSVKNCHDFLKHLPTFNKLDKFYRFYFHKSPTAGIIMLYTAIAQGYREIYLVGIDFYRGGGIDYAFKIENKGNLVQKIPNFKETSFKSFYHYEDLDIQFIQLALSIPEIKIYAISPDSALCEFLPLAQIQNKNQFKIEDKPNGYICDLMQPPSFCLPSKQKLEDHGIDTKNIYVHDLIQPPRHSFNQKLKDYGISNKNIYIKAILDLIHLCKAIFFALKN